MEPNEISIHEAKVFKFMRDSGSAWRTNSEIATGGGVSPRTARHHSRRLVGLGLLDQAEVFPAHKFRLSVKADKRNKAYLSRLVAALEIHGV